MYFGMVKPLPIMLCNAPRSHPTCYLVGESYVAAKVTRPRTDKLLPRDKDVQDLDLEAEAPFGTWVSLILSPSSLFWRSLFVVVVVAVVVGLFVVVVVFVFFAVSVNFSLFCLHHFPYFRDLIGIYFFFSCCCVHCIFKKKLWLSLRPANSGWRQCRRGKLYHVLICRRVHHTSLRFF